MDCCCPDCVTAEVLLWREERLGVVTPAERAWGPWRDGDGFVHGDPQPGASTWRRGIWTGGRWEAQVRTC